MKRWITIALLLLAAFTLPAAAADLAGVRMPDTQSVEGKTLVLNGLGLREATFLKIDVYVAGLYLTEKTKDPAAILASTDTKQLRMHFVRGVGRDEIVKAWREGVTKNAGKDAAPVQDRFEKIYVAMVDVANGDEMVLTQIPGKGVVVNLKGKDALTVPGDDFAKVLWSIWLGPSPPNAELKTGLLGR